MSNAAFSKSTRTCYLSQDVLILGHSRRPVWVLDPMTSPSGLSRSYEVKIVFASTFWWNGHRVVGMVPMSHWLTWLGSLPQVNSHEGMSRIERGEPYSKDTPVPINMTLLWIAGSSELDYLCLHGMLTWWWNKLSLITTVIHIELLSMPAYVNSLVDRHQNWQTDAPVRLTYQVNTICIFLYTATPSNT